MLSSVYSDKMLERAYGNKFKTAFQRPYGRIITLYKHTTHTEQKKSINAYSNK